MRIFIIFLLLVSGTFYLSAQCTGVDVGGTVYLDIPATGALSNVYGLKEANEQGFANVTVTITDANQVVQVATTDANGDWDVSSPVFPVRVEFSWTQSWLKESPFSTTMNASVRHISSNDCAVNLGLFDPSSYMQSPTPAYVNHIRVSGSSIGNTLSSLETTQYNDSGLSSDHQENDGTQGTGPTSSTDATVAQLGSTWGKTLQTSKQRMFISSALWRHAGFASGKGLGDLFVVDYSSGSPASFLGSIDLQGVTPSNGGSALDFGSICRGGGCENDPGFTGIAADYTLPDDPTLPSVDLDAFAKVGKMGYGGLDYDANEEKIWTVNLNQKGIVEIDVSADYASLPGTVNQYLISSLPNAPTCVGGELRPWALTIHQGKGYVGCVCDGLSSQNTANMDAYVLSFDLSNPNAGFTTTFSLPLDYNKNGDDWEAWSDIDLSTGGNWKRYTQPILSDIEFDELNNMYLSFMDRWGLQAGYVTYTPVSGSTTTTEKAQCAGELFKICNNSGVYELEGTGSCPTNYAGSGEFFNDRAGDGFVEGAGGSMVMVPGSNQLLVQIVDPHPEGIIGQPYWSTQGMNTLSLVDGSIENWYSNLYSGSREYNGKGVGMGDIELLTDAAPVEVGNFVWADTNKNGVQDPGESGIANIVIDLVDGANTVLAQATTDANGHFIFSNDPYGTSTASQIYNITGLAHGTSYSLRISDAQGGSQQTALAGMGLTSANTGSGGNENIHDSDGVLAGNNAQIPITTGDIPSIGANNHSFDFGFSVINYDWGDLPDGAAGTAAGDYESLSANNGPRHIIDPNIHLGTTNTIEADALQNTNADGDVDDGLTLMGNESWVPSTTLNIPFSTTNATGSTAHLEAWIDWNNDGDFDDPGEMVADMNDAVSFPTALAITVPAGATQGQNLGFRVRLSTTDNMTPYGEILDGEVEDYLITVECPPVRCLSTTANKH